MIAVYVVVIAILWHVPVCEFLFLSWCGKKGVWRLIRGLGGGV